MSDEGRGRKSWRTGCGYVVFPLLFFVIVAGVLALRPVREAKRVEQDLNDRFGRATLFTPNPDGSFEPDRVEVFLAVRDRLREPCESFRERRARLDELGRMEEHGRFEAESVVEGLKTALVGGQDFLRLMRARNTALSIQGMGIGEYAYIYVLAYNHQLSEIAGRQEGEKPFDARTRNELTQVLRNQRAALESSVPDDTHRQLALDLRAEISALESGNHIFPWQDGLPSHLEASTEPFRQRLDALFCESTVRFALRQKNEHPSGLGK